MRTKGALVLFLLYFGGNAFAQETLTRLSDSFETLAEKISPAVVQILATGYGTEQDASNGSSLLTRRHYSGSGVILDTAGYIITNAHVVSGARKVEVLLAFRDPRGPQRSILKAKGKLVDARLIGLDSETDLAVLKIQEPGLPYVELGDSDSLKPGQIVLAFGSPLGLDNSVTMGVISAVARQLRSEDPMIYIQTDAPINPGNSGGPLVDTDGKVIGINTAIYSFSGGNQGIGFAAPSNIVRNVYQQIRKTGIVRRGEIGVFAQTITPSLAAALSLSQDWGAIVGDVRPGSPAERAGVRVGDIILSLDSKVIENGRQFDVNIYRRTDQESVMLEVQRGSDKLTLQIPVVVRGDEQNPFARGINLEKNVVPRLGIFALDLDDQIAKLIPGLRKQYGMVVAGRMSDAPYWASEFQPGDVIHSVNGALIKNILEAQNVLTQLKAGSAVAVQVERFGKLFYVTFEIE
ncbi:MAG TPA: trypsin-like peptidase domain-containing protein [Acidobacteriota bacterium]